MTIEQVKNRIELFGVKKSHVAKEIGVNISQLSHYLGGRRDLKPEPKQKLRSYLNL